MVGKQTYSYKKANELFEHEIGHRLAEVSSGFSVARYERSRARSAESQDPNEDQNIEELTISFPVIIMKTNLNQSVCT